MRRIGYTRYVAQGGDRGAVVTDAMARQAPEGLLGVHINVLTAVVVPGVAEQLPGESEQERAAFDALNTFTTDGSGYFLEMATRPQTIGYALLDSPVALAAWMLDHDTDGYYKIAGAFVDGRPTGNLTKEHIVDNVTLYWLTGTGASAARDYWEDGRARARFAVEPPPPASVPVGFTTFPEEVWAAPRSWVEVAYPTLSYFNEVDRGGHFAAWEEPRALLDRGPSGVPGLRQWHRPQPRVALLGRARPMEVNMSTTGQSTGTLDGGPGSGDHRHEARGRDVARLRRRSGKELLPEPWMARGRRLRPRRSAACAVDAPRSECSIAFGTA